MTAVLCPIAISSVWERMHRSICEVIELALGLLIWWAGDGCAQMDVDIDRAVRIRRGSGACQRHSPVGGAIWNLRWDESHWSRVNLSFARLCGFSKFVAPLQSRRARSGDQSLSPGLRLRLDRDSAAPVPLWRGPAE